MPRNCPYCDMYTVDDNICTHCGEKLPQDNPIQNNSNQRRVKSSSTGSGSLIGKAIVVGIVVLVVFLGYKFIFANSDIPTYMNEGPVFLTDLVVPDKINIFDFYSDGCGPCKQIAPYLHKLKESRTDLNIIQIDINRKGVKGIDWQSPTVKQFKIKSVPFFLVIDKNGKIMKKGQDAYKYVVEIIQKEGLL